MFVYTLTEKIKETFPGAEVCRDSRGLTVVRGSELCQVIGDFRTDHRGEEHLVFPSVSSLSVFRDLASSVRSILQSWDIPDVREWIGEAVRIYEHFHPAAYVQGRKHRDDGVAHVKIKENDDEICGFVQTDGKVSLDCEGESSRIRSMVNDLLCALDMAKQ